MEVFKKLFLFLLVFTINTNYLNAISFKDYAAMFSIAGLYGVSSWAMSKNQEMIKNMEDNISSFFTGNKKTVNLEITLDTKTEKKINFTAKKKIDVTTKKYIAKTAEKEFEFKNLLLKPEEFKKNLQQN